MGISISKSLSDEMMIKLIGNDRPVILDIGAYDGKDSIRFARLFPDGHIFSFEPSPESFGKLIYNIEDYKNIHPQNIAISNKCGNSKLFYSNNHPQSSSLERPTGHIDIFKDVNWNRTIDIETLTLDWWHEVVCNSLPLDLIWCDVNGAQEKFIDGGRGTLRLATKLLYIEYSLLELYENDMSLYQLSGILPTGFELYDTYEVGSSYGNALFINKRLCND